LIEFNYSPNKPFNPMNQPLVSLPLTA